ncbi:MAG TPA: SUF system NifU family Fe-S cluster assembly protein [Acidimicrobiia bacterium]|nr:SUF system NifU family Fe-S cluster assembly protein [Acidimicrobiia bacterium]
MALEDLYRDVILDHYRNPRHRHPLEHPDATAEGVNPLCGDEVKVELTFDGDRVSDVAVTGQGCSISQSSASMMSAAIVGKTRAEITELAERFHLMMTSEDETAAGLDPERPGGALGDLEALQGVRKYPVRIKCARLPWTTLEQALEER